MIQTVDTILSHANSGDNLSVEEGVILLKQTQPAIIAAIQETADKLRYKQAGDTVTYVINRNINFTNICEQHCSFCAFRRDAGQDGHIGLTGAKFRKKQLMPSKEMLPKFVCKGD
jgi:FO synthase subunit 2